MASELGLMYVYCGVSEPPAVTMLPPPSPRAASGCQVVGRIILDITSVAIVFVPWMVMQYQEPFKRGFYCNDISIRYPYHSNTVPGWALTLLSTILPILVMLLVEGVYTIVHTRQGIPDPHLVVGSNGCHVPYYFFITYKLLASFLFGIATVACMNNIGKLTVGNLRPHFLAVCKINWTDINCRDSYGEYTYITNYVCYGDDAGKIRDARMSFPSGHAAYTVYGMIFLIMYIQRRFYWRHSNLLRGMLQSVFACIAFFVSLSRILDNKHHPGDVVGGVLIGAIVSIMVSLYLSPIYRHSSWMSEFHRVATSLTRDQSKELSTVYNSRTEDIQQNHMDLQRHGDT